MKIPKKIPAMKCVLMFCICICYMQNTKAQSYDVLSYYYNSTPVHGVKIKTNIPFSNGTQMPTVRIEGFDYGTSKPIGLTLVWYIYGSNFYYPAISSWGSYTPDIYLCNESGLVTIFINDKSYYQRFKVSVFAQGMAEMPAWFEGWTTDDEPLSGDNQTLVPYTNKFKGEVTMPGNGIWNSLGNVGIGTLSPSEKLSVNGNVRAKKVIVTQAGWPDYVFMNGYKLRSLSAVESFVKKNKHLPDIPSVKEVEKNGVDVGNTQALLLKKIEELTLYIIEQQKQIAAQDTRIRQLEKNVKKE